MKTRHVYTKPEELACAECQGHGQGMCPHCEQDMDCEHCEGSGLNDQVVNVKMFSAAHLALARKRHIPYPLLDENRVMLGYQTKQGDKLLYADFTFAALELARLSVLEKIDAGIPLEPAGDDTMTLFDGIFPGDRPE